MNRECRIWAIHGNHENREYGILVDRNRENWILAVYMTMVCGNRECRFRFMGIGSVGSVLWESGVKDPCLWESGGRHSALWDAPNLLLNQ